MATRSTPLITLTTDFGLKDPYVAAMKGVIYAVNRALQVVDLTHQIPPQDIVEGTFFLAGALPYYPKGTIHVAVVDPSVGTDRHPIVLTAGGQTLICPDNGLPTLFLRDHPLQEARIIRSSRFMRKEISATFHGRDVFASAAAHLANGSRMSDMGPEIDIVTTLDLPLPKKSGARVQGEILHVDRFGNLVTNIEAPALGERKLGAIRAGTRRIPGGLRKAYAEVPDGSPLALINSMGYLEIAVNGGSAQTALHLERGATVTVEFAPR